MESVIIENFTGDKSEVSTSVYYDGIISIVELDNQGDNFTTAHYTPEQARKLAAALIKAAEEVEAEVDE